MKRAIPFLAVMLAVLCLVTACRFTSNFSDSTGSSVMKAAPKVEQMLSALSDGDVESALVLMYPERAAISESGLAQMCDYLAGRKIAQTESKGVTRQESSGTNGVTSQENGTFRVVLEDGTEFFVSVSYYTAGSAEGFLSFQLVLGVI